jgi:hypothetical protein
MFVRINTIYGDKDKIDEAIDYIEESDRPVVEASAGNGGLATFVDRDGGLIVAASYWDEPLHSSEAALTRVREGASAIANGNLTTESYEIVADAEMAAPPPGAAVRMTRMQIELARIEGMIAFVRDEFLPRVTTFGGLCSAQLLLDRSSGECVVMSVWADDHSAEKARGALEQQLLLRAGSRFGAMHLRLESYAMIGTSMQLS